MDAIAVGDVRMGKADAFLLQAIHEMEQRGDLMVGEIRISICEGEMGINTLAFQVFQSRDLRNNRRRRSDRDSKRQER